MHADVCGEEEWNWWVVRGAAMGSQKAQSVGEEFGRV